MGPISGTTPSPARPSALAAAGVQEPSKVRHEDRAQGPTPPARDRYDPEEKQEPAGLYWLGQDEEGQPKVYFDDPERPEDPAAGPEREAPGKKAEQCTGDTGQVDREIQRLKTKRDRLEQRIGTETDEARLRDLERELAQVERELSRKDNDAYRRQHTVFS